MSPHESNSAYIPLQILDRVTETFVYDGAGILMRDRGLTTPNDSRTRGTPY